MLCGCANVLVDGRDGVAVLVKNLRTSAKNGIDPALAGRLACVVWGLLARDHEQQRRQRHGFTCSDPSGS